MQKTVLVICPSRGRPQECARMIESFNATAEISTLKLCLDMDDPCLQEYMDVCNGKAAFVIDQRRTITQIFNEHWRYAPANFRWFSCTNDDFVYKTKSWDLKLVSTIASNGGIGIAYGNDLLAGANMPTTSIISREIVEALGWLQMPNLNHLYGDTTWLTIGRAANCLFHNPSVIIEHRHFLNRSTPMDKIYERTNSKEMYFQDEAAFMEWWNNDRLKDIEKVKKLCSK